MKNRIVIIAILLISNICFSDEIPVPEFSDTPLKIPSVSDNGLLIIGDRSDKSFKFWFNLQGANGHQCYMSGTANRTSPYGKYSYYKKQNDQKCYLTIHAIENSFILLDDGCQYLFCGSRASINETVFTPK